MANSTTLSSKTHAFVLSSCCPLLLHGPILLLHKPQSTSGTLFTACIVYSLSWPGWCWSSFTFIVLSAYCEMLSEGRNFSRGHISPPRLARQAHVMDTMPSPRVVTSSSSSMRSRDMANKSRLEMLTLGTGNRFIEVRLQFTRYG